VGYFLNVMEGSSQSLLLSSPRLTVYNGQRAYIAVITQRNLVTDISVSVAPSAVGYDITVSTIQTGVVFDVRPIVSADRHYVQMDLQPARSELIAINNFNIGSVILPSGAIQQLSVQQPVVETTMVKTTASVPDGGTLLVGGLKFSFEQQLEEGLPVLSQIPLVNRLFTRTAVAREKDNLIILVTPRIIIQEEGERRAQ
jgi:type II secretory pathway component GspD/PulD (secretin)